MEDDLAVEGDGGLYAVHRELGPGFKEAIYATALCLELDQRGLKFEREKKIDVKYREWTIPGKHGAACSGFDDWQLGPQVAGKLDCDHCRDAPEPRQFRGHEGEECTGYYRPTGEKLKGWLVCY